MKKCLSVFFLFVIIFSYSCAPKFSCQGTWSGTKCESMNSVYDKRDEVIASKDDMHQKLWEGKARKDGPMAANIENQVVAISRTESRESSDEMNKLRGDIIERMALDKNIPLRMPTTILEIWIAPYEDENGDLRKPEMLYTEVENRKGRWIFSEKASVAGVGGVMKPEMYEGNETATTNTQPKQQVKPKDAQNDNIRPTPKDVQSSILENKKAR